MNNHLKSFNFILSSDYRFRLLLKIFVLLIATFFFDFTLFSADTDMPTGDEWHDEGGSTFLQLFVLLIFGAMAALVCVGILIGISLVIAAVGMVLLSGLMSALVGMGMVSVSALIAIIQRSFSDGVRAFHYQLSAILHIPCGIGLIWVANAWFLKSLTSLQVIILGTAVRIAGGLLFAYVCNWILRKSWAYFLGKCLIQ